MENQNLQGQPPKNWLVESILATIFCCIPLGIVAIIKATQVESKFYAGQVDEAILASKEAAKWTKITFFVGIAAYVIITIIYAIIGAAWFAAINAASTTY